MTDALSEPLGAPRKTDTTAWRAETCRQFLMFSGRLRSTLPVDSARLRAHLRSGEVQDAPLRGAMQSLGLNYDRVLILTGAFIQGAAYHLPASPHVRTEVEALAGLGLVRTDGAGRFDEAWSGLTERGRQLAVFAIYRILTAASEGANRE